MTYTAQIEAHVAEAPTTDTASVPYYTGVTSLPAYPHVAVQFWDEDFCELTDADGGIVARFKLVG